MNFFVEDFESLRLALATFDRFLKENGITDESIFDSHLVLRELAGNVLEHSKGQATILGEIVNEQIEVEVRSSDKYIPPEKSALPEWSAERGRGLYLVDRISERRFITPDGGVKVVIKTTYKK